MGGVCYTSVDRELQAMVQKQPVKAGSCNLSKNGRCGAKFGNTRCAWGFCSKFNWCGTTAQHKATHQPAFDASPHCTKKAAKKQPKCNLSKNGKCGKANGGTICPVGYCSKAGTCGTDKMHKATKQIAYSASKQCSAKTHLKRKIHKANNKAAKKAAKKAQVAVKKADVKGKAHAKKAPVHFHKKVSLKVKKLTPYQKAKKAKLAALKRKVKAHILKIQTKMAKKQAKIASKKLKATVKKAKITKKLAKMHKKAVKKAKKVAAKKA